MSTSAAYFASMLPCIIYILNEEMASKCMNDCHRIYSMVPIGWLPICSRWLRCRQIQIELKSLAICCTWNLWLNDEYVDTLLKCGNYICYMSTPLEWICCHCHNCLSSQNNFHNYLVIRKYQIHSECNVVWRLAITNKVVITQYLEHLGRRNHDLIRIHQVYFCDRKWRIDVVLVYFLVSKWSRQYTKTYKVEYEENAFVTLYQHNKTHTFFSKTIPHQPYKLSCGKG